MSRFDDFAKSRAEGRGLFSALKRTRSGAELDGESGVSRRDLMKKAGIVTGAAVVGSTVIQSVTAPAFATSHCTNASDPQSQCGGTSTTCPRCADGGLCNSAADCASGYCNMTVSPAVCAPPPVAGGQPCTGNTQQAKDQSCLSGYCGSDGKCATRPSGVAFGSSCHAGTQAQADLECGSGTNGVCVGMTSTTTGTCKVKDLQPCSPRGSSANCASGTCSSSGASGVCQVANGGACTKNSDCISNKCTGVICTA